MSLAFEPVTEELLVSDLLGFADYLAQSLDDDPLTDDVATWHLASAATTSSEQRALDRAAAIAVKRPGLSDRAAALLSAAREAGRRT